MVSHENRILWPDGSVHWIGVEGRVKYDREGRAVRVIGVVADITDRKQAEEALWQSEERLRAQRERMPIGCIVYDERNEVSQMNPAAEKIFGYSQAELRGRHASVIVPDELARMWTAFCAAWPKAT